MAGEDQRVGAGVAAVHFLAERRGLEAERGVVVARDGLAIVVRDHTHGAEVIEVEVAAAAFGLFALGADDTASMGCTKSSIQIHGAFVELADSYSRTTSPPAPRIVHFQLPDGALKAPIRSSFASYT